MDLGYGLLDSGFGLWIIKEWLQFVGLTSHDGGLVGLD